MKNKGIKFMLSEADRHLFIEMRHNYVSDAEKIFFETMKRKEQYDSAFSNELLVFEKENEDNVYLLRKYYDTYLVGYYDANGNVMEFECETLAATLALYLDECVGYLKHITLIEWLRKYDYSVVRYNRNYDDD